MSKTVRAKFICNSIEEFANQKRAKLQAVYGNGTENSSYAKYTPSAQLEMTIDKETPASEFFQPGKSYYLDFSIAE